MLARLWRTCLLPALVVAVGAYAASGAVAPDSARRTPLGETIRRCSLSALDIIALTPAPDGRIVSFWGSATIVHPAGYALTNQHVIGGAKHMVRLENGKTFLYEPVMLDPAEDLAVVRFHADEPLRVARIGRSNDLMLGETTIAIGNSVGLPHTATTGVVSRIPPPSGADELVQTSAATNHGNSGGPLFNALGELIGVMQLKNEGMENIAFAIPIDRALKVCAEHLLLERRGLWLGMTVRTLGPVEVTEVATGSAADEAGVKVGDVVCRIDETPIQSSLAYHLSLLDKKDGDEVPIKVRRGDESLKLTVTVEQIPPRPADRVEGLVNGLNYSAYSGDWEKLPNFDSMRPIESGRAMTFSAAACKQKTDEYGLKFAGYVEVPADGAYTFYTESDDGSRLWIGGRLVVDNDGLHGAGEANGGISLKAGKHPITVEYFERRGDESLVVSYEGPDLRKQEVPAPALFVKQ